MRHYWTEEEIENESRKIAESIGHFPSNQDLLAMGRGDLANQIGKHGGFLHWSNRVGVARKHSDSDTGWDGERAFLSACHTQGLSAIRPEGIKCPFDILVDDVLRIDVKAAKRATYTSGGRAHIAWFYRVGKIPQADLVVFYQLDTTSFYAVPWHLCPTSNVSISASGGKYAPFLNNWDLIRDLVRLRKEERERFPEVA